MTAIFTAALDPNVLGTIAIATGYGRPTSLETLQRVGVSDFRSSYVVGVTLPELVKDVDLRYSELLVRLAGRPALYVAASRDAMVSPKSVRELYDRAPEPKSFATIESDHTYAAEHARATVLEWLGERHSAAQRTAHEPARTASLQPPSLDSAKSDYPVRSVLAPHASS